MTYLRLLFCLAVLCQPCRIYAVEPSHQERSEPGELKSPGYPRPYPKGAEDSWVFERPSGVWAVVFEDIDIEKSEACADDYLLVRDLTRSVNLVRTCGDRPPGPVYSYGNKLLISFHSDRLNEGRGFRLRVLHDLTTEALKARLVQPSTTAKHVPAEPVEFTKDDLMVLVLSLALLFALLVVFCLAGWILYQHCYRHGHSPCCACSRSSATSKQVTINMEPTVVARKAKSYTKQARPKDPPVDPSGYGHPNVYLPMPDSDTDQSLQSPSQRTGTDVTSSGQLPMYHTPQPAYMEEVKFIGVM